MLDASRVQGWRFPEVADEYAETDCLHYALSLGVGRDPTSPKQLPFVYEKGLVPFPTMAVTLGYPGPFLADPATGADFVRTVHGEHSLQLHRELPCSARVTSLNRVEAVIDKGAGRGALVYMSRETRDAESNAPISTQLYTLFCRGDGGFGGPSGPIQEPHRVPDTAAPDAQFEWPTLPQSALLYRLHGDMNPLHADPKFAVAAGFSRPILHGLCTFGIAGIGLGAVLCDWRAQQLTRIDVRFSGPLYPGETVVVSIWARDSGRASFRCSSKERDVIVIDNGYCEYNT